MVGRRAGWDGTQRSTNRAHGCLLWWQSGVDTGALSRWH